jgi:hypothetical protein
MNYFLTIPMQTHHHDPMMQALQISAGMSICFIPDSFQSPTNMMIIGFILILEHSSWLFERDRPSAGILAAFQVYQSSFSAAVQTAITNAFPEVITHDDTFDRTRMDGVASRLLDVIMANRLR